MKTLVALSATFAFAASALAAPETRTAEANGIHIQYPVEGQGEPILVEFLTH